MAASRFPVLFLVGFVAAVAVMPYMTAEARYLPTRGSDDRLTRLKELLTDVSNPYCVIYFRHRILFSVVLIFADR